MAINHLLYNLPYAFIRLDYICELIPGVSTINAIKNIALKYFIAPHIPSASSPIAHYFRYIEDKTLARSIFLLIPFANIGILFYDLFSLKQPFLIALGLPSSRSSPTPRTAGEALRSTKLLLADRYPYLKDDKEFVLSCVKTNGFELWHANKQFFQDKDVVLEAVKQNPAIYLRLKKQIDSQECHKTGVYPDMTPEDALYWDKEIMLEAAKRGVIHMKYIINTLRRGALQSGLWPVDFDVLLEIFLQNPKKGHEWDAYAVCNNEGFMLRAIERDVSTLQYTRFERTIEFIAKAVERNREVMKGLPPDQKRVPLIFSAALTAFFSDSSHSTSASTEMDALWDFAPQNGKDLWDLIQALPGSTNRQQLLCSLQRSNPHLYNQVQQERIPKIYHLNNKDLFIKWT